MPIKLIPPRKDKQSKSWYLRGTYIGIYVDKSCRTHRRSVALSQLKQITKAIERGEYSPRETAANREQPNFVSAAVNYMEAGRPSRYIAKLIKHFGETPLHKIDQAAIDEAAVTLYPGVTAGTRNACVYTPLSAILHHAGIEKKLRRPKGAKGRVITDWLTHEDAFGIVRAADKVDAELGLLLRFLLYTGVRLGAALGLERNDVMVSEAMAWVRHQKGQPSADVRLRDDLRDALAAHLLSHNFRRVFRFHQGGHLKHLLVRAKLAYLGLPCPARRPKNWRTPPYRLSWVNFHSFRHTWATWMRRYGGADVQGLVATKNWRDPRSAARYSHAVARDEWSRVDDCRAWKIRGNHRRVYPSD